MSRLLLIVPAFTVAVAASMYTPGKAENDRTAPRKQYPETGDIYYDGQYYWDSYFQFLSPGPWRSTSPGFEMDISIAKSEYFDSCTATVTLPQGYNDCPTSGWFEPGQSEQFGVGTYDAKQIVAAAQYVGKWTFAGGSGSGTDYKVTWQETRHGLCPFDSPGCMIGACDVGCGGYLVQGAVAWGTTHYKPWNY